MVCTCTVWVACLQKVLRAEQGVKMSASGLLVFLDRKFLLDVHHFHAAGILHILRTLGRCVDEFAGEIETFTPGRRRRGGVLLPAFPKGRAS